MFIQLLAVGLYFSVLLFIGIASRKKNTTAQDFVLGSRKLNFWVTAISAHADDMSSWLFMAFPMAIFLSGPYKLWVGIGLILGMYFNWHIIAPRLRRETEHYDSNTLSSFLERRFGDTSGIIRNISAIMILFFMTYYFSSGLVATGRLFETLFGIDYYFGISFAILIMVSYVFSGGFVSVAYADFAQGIFLLAMIILVPIYAVFHMGDVSNLFTVVKESGRSLALIPDFSFTALFAIFSLSAGWGLGYFGQPHILTKFMGIRNVDDLKKSKYLGMTWQVLALFFAAMVGLLGIVFFKDGLDKPEMIFVEMTKALFSPFATALIICGIFSANLSTMDSQILVCATVMSEDFYKRILRKTASAKEMLTVSRISVLLFAGVAFYMAYGQSATIMSIVEYAWSGLGSAFGPVILTALYSKTVNRYGVIAGISTGGIISAVWPTINPFVTSIQIVPLIPGFFISLGVIYAVSLATRTREQLATAQ